MSINIVPSVQQSAREGRGPLTRYVNITIDNADNEFGKVAEYDNTYNSDILPRCEDYLAGVINFSLPLKNLPLYIIETTTPTGNVCTMQVGVCHNMDPADIAAGILRPVTSFMQPLIWEPQQMGLAAVDEARRYGYSYEHIVNITNTAIQTAHLAAGSPGGSSNYPIFSYDEQSHLFSWRVPDLFIDAAGPTFGWSLVWNKSFDVILNNFNTIQNGSQYILEDTKSALTNTVAGNLFVTQDFPTTDNFNTIERILVLTNTIPISADIYPNGLSKNQQSAKQYVLCDISLDSENSIGIDKSKKVYEPQFIQWSDMTTSLPLRNINVRFVWIDSLNNAHSIPVDETDTISCRLAFFNKALKL